MMVCNGLVAPLPNPPHSPRYEDFNFLQNVKIFLFPNRSDSCIESTFLLTLHIQVHLSYGLILYYISQCKDIFLTHSLLKIGLSPTMSDSPFPPYIFASARRSYCPLAHTLPFPPYNSLFSPYCLRLSPISSIQFVLLPHCFRLSPISPHTIRSFAHCLRLSPISPVHFPPTHSSFFIGSN